MEDHGKSWQLLLRNQSVIVVLCPFSPSSYRLKMAKTVMKRPMVETCTRFPPPTKKSPTSSAVFTNVSDALLAVFTTASDALLAVFTTVSDALFALSSRSAVTI